MKFLMVGILFMTGCGTMLQGDMCRHVQSPASLMFGAGMGTFQVTLEKEGSYTAYPAGEGPSCVPIPVMP